MPTRYERKPENDPCQEYVDVAGSRQPVPRVDFKPGLQYADANRRFSNVTSITRTPGGRLWCGFAGGGDGEGHLNYGLVVFSDDDGLNWTSPQIVFDTDGEGPVRSDHVVVWTAPDGVLWIMWNQYPEGLGGHRSSTWAITCANPDADDRKWTAPRKLVDEQNLLNKPTVLADGTWIFPTGCWFDDGKDRQRCRVQCPSRPLISRDGGKTFEPGGPLHAPENPDYDEYQIIERADGSLVSFNRHGLKGQPGKPESEHSILEGESRDGGRTWTEQRPNGIPNARARLVFMKLQSGAWLLVKHGDMIRVPVDDPFKGRTRMTAYLSRDEGKTWEGGLMLEERDCAYPDGFQAPDGTIYVSYDRQRQRQAEMLLALFTEADVLAGSLVSGRAALSLMINKTAGISREVKANL